MGWRRARTVLCVAVLFQLRSTTVTCYVFSSNGVVF